MSSSRKVIAPIAIFTLLLLLGLLFALWYFNARCLTSTNIYQKAAAASVLGASTTTIPNTTTVNAGEPGQFLVTNNVNQVLNGGTLLLTLNGGGTISSVEGDGICTVTTDTEAICTDLNLDAGEDTVYTVNFVADEDCLVDSVITLDSVLNNLLGTEIDTQTATIGCTPATTTPTTTGGDTNNTTTTTTTGSTSDDDVLVDEDSDITFTGTEGSLALRVLDRHNAQVGQCMTNNTVMIGGAAILLYVLFLLFLSFFMAGRDEVVVRETVM